MSEGSARLVPVETRAVEDDESNDESGAGSSEDDSSAEEPEWVETQDQPPVYIIMLCFMFMFQGYGAMVGNPAHALKHKLDIDDRGLKGEFQNATASFQLTKMLMRVLQIAFLVVVQPNGIVYLSYAVMMAGLLVPLVLIWGLGMTDLWVVYLQYSLGGIAVGLFEGTFLSVISPLGKDTKTFAIIGAPLGFAMLNTVLGTLEHFGMEPWVYYVYSLVCLPIAIFIFHSKAPAATAKGQGKGCQVFINSVKKWKQWLPHMVPWFIAKFIGNFVLEDGFPLLFTTYNTQRVPVLGPEGTKRTVPFDLYRAWFWFPCMALGDTISRRVPQYIPLTSWKVCIGCLLLAIVMCVGGEALDFFMIGLLNGLAVFIANFGNGFIYGLSAKFIDAFLPQEHQYAAYNLWCFIGDLGGYAGQSDLSVAISRKVCAGHHYTYVCAATAHPAANATAAATTSAAAAGTTAASVAASTAAPTAATVAPPTAVATPPALLTAPPLPTLQPLPSLAPILP